jgi:hypothetical protein
MFNMERDGINHDHLRKDELQYEILIGKGKLPQHCKVNDLKTILWDIAWEPIDLQCLQDLDSEGELRTIDSKLNEFKEIVMDCHADSNISRLLRPPWRSSS